MSKEKIITGIDAGSTKVGTTIASVSDNKVSIIGVSGLVPSKGINKGNIVDIDAAVESIASSLERAERMAGISVSSAFVTVNGNHIDTLNSRGVVAVNPHQHAEISADDVLRVTEAARAVTIPSSREIIHVIPRDFIVDSQDGIKDPTGMYGVRLEVETNIIHGSSTAMKNLTKCIQKVGVEVEEMVYTGIASSEAVLTDAEKELGTVLIDIGGGTSSMIVFLEGSPIHSSVLPIGAKHLTLDLTYGLHSNIEDAEKIKLKICMDRLSTDVSEKGRRDEFDVSEFALDTPTVPRSLLYRILDSRLAEIFSLIALDLDKAGLMGKLPSGAVLTGGGALTTGIEKVAKTSLRMPVRVATPKGVTGLIDEIQNPAFSATVGAVLYGVGLYKNNSILSFDKTRGSIQGNLSRFFEKLKSFLP